MALNWMDNFNIYGTDGGNTARMLNGVYAELTRATLAVDPDPTAGGSLVLLKYGGGTGGDMRKVLPNARTTVGALGRIWLPKLPNNPTIAECPVFFGFRDLNNVPHIEITTDPSGNIIVNRVDTVTRVQLGITATPVLVANAWKHVEAKVFLDAAVGTVQVRVEGVTVLTVAATRTTNNVAGAIPSCMQVAQTSAQDAAADFYLKDYIVWDNTTGFNNDFMGSCQVFKIIPDADVALNWSPSPADGVGYDKINEVTPDDDTRYISAAAPGIPAAYKCSLSDLPVTVTSVRGIMAIQRSRKTDGGDGNIQMGAISGGVTSLGADRPITTAYTYWWDMFDADPNGGGAWTRVSVNAMNLQINRTL